MVKWVESKEHVSFSSDPTGFGSSTNGFTGVLTTIFTTNGETMTSTRCTDGCYFPPSRNDQRSSVNSNYCSKGRWRLDSLSIALYLQPADHGQSPRSHHRHSEP
ncbi:hypothetical protein M514_07441 [Trichuris suis]|uniref:Uncharacterized protein n=1 Tax=Trichuris suis TaxID=68888 RepID=A0A085M3E8_9BILA|nr:hypothetical protein M513_07441 [Trichuris suis]KFD67131.1 hypothetical protein M514_07441 [Trichuris suis]